MSLQLPVDLARENSPPGWRLQGFADVQQPRSRPLRPMTAKEAAVSFTLQEARSLEVRYDFAGLAAGQRLEVRFNGEVLRVHRVPGPGEVGGALARVEGRAGQNVLTVDANRTVAGADGIDTGGSREVAALFLDLQVAPYTPPQGWWGRSAPAVSVALLITALLLWQAARLLGFGTRRRG